MSSITKLYGIPNCDKVKLARAWFAEHSIAITFHDYKKQGVPGAELNRWVRQLGYEALLNKQGTTWRKLDAEQQAQVKDAASAIALMMSEPSVIKRPVVVKGTAVIVGYAPEQFATLL